MKISLACDHGGYLLKEEVKKHLLSKGYEIEDCGTYSTESCDYPVFARKASLLVADKICDLGIVICTSGEGVCMTANKVKGIRCGLAYNVEVASLIKQHNNANMMALGAKYISQDDALRCVDNFINTEFEGGRHIKRVNLIEAN